jgi:Tol biopolymer transport system component
LWEALTNGTFSVLDFGTSKKVLSKFQLSAIVHALINGGMTMADGAPALSPDGSTIALRRTQDGNNDIWLLDVADGALKRVTSDKSNDGFPVWSADGRTIYFASNRKGPFDLYQKPVVGSAKEKTIVSLLGQRLPKEVSPDGRSLLYTARGSILGLELNGKSREFEVIMGPGLKDFPQFSPDGRLIAYQSNESGRFEIYIQQYPSGTRGPITSGGGAHVRWRPDGKELFYIAPNGMLMAVPVNPTGPGQELRFGAPAALFAPPMVGNIITSAYGQQYAVSRDGQRFLVASATKADSLTVIQNWRK